MEARTLEGSRPKAQEVPARRELPHTANVRPIHAAGAGHSAGTVLPPDLCLRANADGWSWGWESSEQSTPGVPLVLGGLRFMPAADRRGVSGRAGRSGRRICRSRLAAG
jgi:hypothetical protein